MIVAIVLVVIVIMIIGWLISISNGIERAKIKVTSYDDSNREVSSEEYRIYPYDEVKNISQKLHA